MKIVITGALGHIGSQLIRELPSHFNNLQLVLIDNLLTQRYCSLFKLPSGAVYTFIEDDVRTADLMTHLTDAAAVIHLAGITTAAQSFETPEAVAEHNFMGTQQVANACAASGIPLFFPSTTSVYGTNKSVVAEDCEPSDLQPQSPYAASKLREEALLAQLATTQNLHYVIYRFGTIFGTSPGMRFHTAVNKFCWQAAHQQPITVWRTALNQIRAYLDLQDAIAAVVLALQKPLFDTGIYNVVTINATVQQIIDSINKQRATTVTLVDSQSMNDWSYEVSTRRIEQQGAIFVGDLDKVVAKTLRLLQPGAAIRQ